MSLMHGQERFAEHDAAHRACNEAPSRAKQPSGVLLGGYPYALVI